LNFLFNKQYLQRLAILLVINLFFLFKEIFVIIVVLIDILLSILLLKNLLLLIGKSILKSKNTTIDKRVLLANFFARAKKLVINIFLILSFNLVTLDFVNCKKLLKTIAIIFLKNFLILINLLIAITTRRNQKS